MSPAVASSVPSPPSTTTRSTSAASASRVRTTSGGGRQQRGGLGRPDGVDAAARAASLEAGERVAGRDQIVLGDDADAHALDAPWRLAA